MSPPSQKREVIPDCFWGSEPSHDSTSTTSSVVVPIANMWSLARQLLVGSLVVWSAAAELTFVAEAHTDGGADITSDLNFVKIPPRQRWRHRSPRNRDRPPSGGSKRDTVSFSGNWCGASQHSTTTDQIVSAWSHFTAPDLKLRPNIPQTQYAAAWVGIDGASCTQALLQGGVTTVVSAASLSSAIRAIPPS